MNVLRLAVANAICAFLLGCAQVPPQSVELSATLGRDLLELQRSHRKAVDLLHDRDIERVNTYMQQTAIPTYVGIVVTAVGPKLAADLAKANAANATQADKDLIYDEMRKTVLGISSRIEKQRQELSAPIENARRERLQELDLAYAQMQRANSVLTAHLASIVKVSSVQDELLAKAGLKDFRQKVGDTALTLDKQIEGALSSAANAEDAVAKVKAVFEKLNKQTSNSGGEP